MKGDKGVIFVFGSNRSGVHGAGSAKEAYRNWGAIWGQGIGPQGRAYGIPTKDHDVRTVLSLEDIKIYVDAFLGYARTHPEFEFRCVAIGCGLAGYTEKQVAPLFKDAPANVVLPFEFNFFNERAQREITEGLKP